MFNKVKTINIIKRFDYILLLLVAVVTVIGFFVLKSAAATMNTGSSIVKTQLVSIIIGAVICLILSLIDYTYFKPWGYFIFIVAIGLLIYVIFYGYGRLVDGIGSNSWILLGGYTFQPTEVAKVAYVMVIPALLANLKEEFSLKIFLLTILTALAPIGLILSQPEFGSAVVFTVSLIFMLFIYGIKFKWFAIGTGAVAALLPVIWLFLEKFQRDRIFSILTPDAENVDTSHIDRAKMAIGSGRLKGMGLFNGTQTQSGLPIKDTDFIFSVVGEELGFIGASLVIIILFLIIARIIYISANTDDLYGRYMTIGIAGMMMFHFIENVGMNLGLLPVTGIPLPFVSGGGTAMIINFALIGLVLSVSIRKKQSIT
ncbi:MAG: rod shape-determining protein RodA [Clostridiales bacterium]|nr:rod shape-determining protein RodA [Clostridiales bacterium]